MLSGPISALDRRVTSVGAGVRRVEARTKMLGAQHSIEVGGFMLQHACVQLGGFYDDLVASTFIRVTRAHLARLMGSMTPGADKRPATTGR